MEDYRNIFYNNYDSKFNRSAKNVTIKDLESQHSHYLLKVLPKLSSFNLNAKILELGCGPGYLLSFLRQNGFTNLIGIDISEEQVIISKNKNFNVIHIDVIEFLSKNQTKWDVIFAFDFIEHFKKEELSNLFELVNTSLTDGGIFFMRTPNGDGFYPNKIIYGDLTHQTIFNQNSLSQLLSATGFKEQIFYENPPLMKNIRGVVRSMLWKLIKMLLNFILLVEVGQKQKLWTRDFFCVAKK